MIQTSYVSLEHPYQIIEYNGMLGIQIGTLIVTKDVSDDVEGGYAIETHSHPVVSYFNKQLRPDFSKSKSMSLPRPFEGVVWDKVELYELNVLAREGESLSWRDYMSYCRKIRLGELKGSIKDADLIITNTYGELSDWGISISDPKGYKDGEYTLYVEVDGIMNIDGKEYLYTNGDMGIVVEKDDKLMMMANILKQAKCYLSVFNYFYNCRCEVTFWTSNLFLQEFTDELKKHTDTLTQDEYVDEDDNVGMWMAAEDEAE